MMLIFTLIFCFVSLLGVVRADDIIDSNDGGSITINPTGKGSWTSDAVGFRLSLVSKTGDLRKSIVIVNDWLNDYEETSYFNSSNKPKFVDSFVDLWKTREKFTNSYRVDSDLPSNWKTSAGETWVLDDYLKNNNHFKLRSYINEYMSTLFKNSDDYIIIEPMARINGFFATAHEFFNINIDHGNYAAVLGGNNGTYTDGGVLSETIYTEDNFKIGSFTILAATRKNTTEKIACLKSKTCGAGMGIFMFKNVFDDYGDLKILKYDENGNVIIPEPQQDPTVNFEIYKKDNNNWISISTTPLSINLSNTSSASISLKPGTYKIVETKAPYGYDISGKVNVGTATYNGSEITVTITKGVMKTVTFYNKKKSTIRTCEQDISGSENDRNKRIEVYLKWEEKGKKYTNLLDFTIPNPTAQKLCSQASCSSTMTTACLSASNTSSIFQNFNSNDLSCYDQKLEINNGAYTAFCATAYNLSNTLNLTNNSFGTVRSGSIVINKSGNVVSSTFIKKCYIHGTTSVNSVNSYSGFESLGKSKYNVKYIYLNNKNLIKSTTVDTSTAATVLSSYNAIEKQWTRVVQYSLNPVYTEIASGKVDVCENSNLCKFLGYGFESKLNEEGNISVPFSFKLNDTVYSNTCTYTATNSLIDDDLKLEFRSISKTNPFPSKDGGGRTVGSNWCEGENCTSSNSIVESVIKNSNDSYNSTGKGAIYRIELDASTIKEIREYNKNRKYDEYDLECDANATNCESKFLEQFNIIRLQ